MSAAPIRCLVCRRIIRARADGAPRPHKVLGYSSAYPRKAEREAVRQADWCPGGARQLALL